MWWWCEVVVCLSIFVLGHFNEVHGVKSNVSDISKIFQESLLSKPNFNNDLREDLMVTGGDRGQRSSSSVFRMSGGSKQIRVNLCQGAIRIGENGKRQNFVFKSEEQRIWDVPAFAILLTDENERNSVYKFRLEDGTPFCGLSVTKLISISEQDEREQILSSEVESIGFLRNGYFKIQRDFYNVDEYCVAEISEDQIVLKYCPPDCTKARPCVQKCFPPGEVMGFYPKRKPMSSGDIEFLPKFYDDFPNSNSSGIDLKNVRPHFVQNRPKSNKTEGMKLKPGEFSCPISGIQFLPFSEAVAEDLSVALNKSISILTYHVQIDGRVFIERLDDYNCPKWIELPPGNFCVDGIRNIGREGEFTDDENTGLMISCPLPHEQPPDMISLLYGILMIASSLFLLLTFIVYCLLWTGVSVSIVFPFYYFSPFMNISQQNIHGWTIMGHTASLYFTYIFLGMTHIIRVKYVELVNTTFCYINGMLGHFFFLSTFSWLTLISFDLWWTFRSIVPTKRTQGTRILIHLLIGWGLPAVIVIVSACLDFIFEDQCTPILLPKYGQRVCYIEQKALGLYVYYPAAVSLLFNLTFFCVTIFKLYHYKKNTRVAIKNNQNNRHMIGIFTKLFFVMGITWIFEFVSWLHVGPNTTWYWAVIDIWNILQAVAIFYIYVCKPDILESLENKYPNTLNKYILRFIRRVTSGMEMRETSSRGKASSSAGELEEMKTKTSSLPRSI